MLSTLSKQTNSVREEDQLVLNEDITNETMVDTAFTNGFPKSLKKQKSPQ